MDLLFSLVLRLQRRHGQVPRKRSFVSITKRNLLLRGYTVLVMQEALVFKEMLLQADQHHTSQQVQPSIQRLCLQSVGVSLHKLLLHLEMLHHLRKVRTSSPQQNKRRQPSEGTMKLRLLSTGIKEQAMPNPHRLQLLRFRTMRCMVRHKEVHPHHLLRICHLRLKHHLHKPLEGPILTIFRRRRNSEGRTKLRTLLHLPNNSHPQLVLSVPLDTFNHLHPPSLKFCLCLKRPHQCQAH